MPDEAHTTPARSERTRGKLSKVFVWKMCFRNTGCFRKCFRKIVRHSGLFVWVFSESWRHLRALLLELWQKSCLFFTKCSSSLRLFQEPIMPSLYRTPYSKKLLIENQFNTRASLLFKCRFSFSSHSSTDIDGSFLQSDTLQYQSCSLYEKRQFFLFSCLHCLWL